MLVARFAHIQRGIVLAIQYDMCRLPALTIDIPTATACHFLNDGIPDATIGIIATVVHQQGFILVEWLVLKERVR